jgi:hypothetical protein
MRRKGRRYRRISGFRLAAHVIRRTRAGAAAALS